MGWTKRNWIKEYFFSSYLSLSISLSLFILMSFISYFRFVFPFHSTTFSLTFTLFLSIIFICSNNSSTAADKRPHIVHSKKLNRRPYKGQRPKKKYKKTFYFTFTSHCLPLLSIFPPMLCTFTHCLAFTLTSYSSYLFSRYKFCFIWSNLFLPSHRLPFLSILFVLLCTFTVCLSAFLHNFFIFTFCLFWGSIYLFLFFSSLISYFYLILFAFFFTVEV